MNPCFDPARCLLAGLPARFFLAWMAVWAGPADARAPGAASASIALEEAIYAAEVLDDAAAALVLLDGIVAQRADAVRPVWEEAVARSAMLLQAAGRTDEAAARARLLQGDNRAPASRWQAWAGDFLERVLTLPLLPQPWPRDEYLVYRVSSLAGGDFGFQVLWSGQTERDGNPVLDLRSWLFISPSNTVQQGSLLASPVAEGFLPLRMRGKVHLADVYEAAYDHPAQSVTVSMEGIARPLALPKGQPVFDAEQFFHMARVLKGEPGRTLRFTTSLTGGIFAETSLEMDGLESITAMGVERMAERWKAEIRVADISVQSFLLWLQPEGARTMLRLKADSYLMDLESATLRPGMGPMERGLTAFPFSYKLPAGWAGYENAPGDTASRLHLISSDGLAAAVWLVSHTAPAASTDAAEALAADLMRLRQVLPEFTTLEADAPPAREIGGRPAVPSAATFLDRGRPVREQRFYFDYQDRIQWVVLRAPAGAWDRYWGEMEAFMDSIRLSAGEGAQP